VTDSSPVLTSDAAQRAARNVGVVAVAQILSKGVLFAWQLILIPLLGPTEYGVYGTVNALMLIGVAITGFGMGVIVIREVARQRERAGRYLSAALFMQTLLGALSYILLQIAALLLDYSPELRGFLAIAALSLLVDMLGNVSYDQLIAHERMATAAAVEVGHIVVRIALAGIALVLGFGLLGVYGVTLATGLGRAAVLWAAVLRGGVRPHFPLDRVVAGGLLRDGAPGAAQALVMTAYQNVDRLVTATLIGAQAVGYLSAAFVIIVGMVELLSTTVFIAVYPLMSRLSGAGSDPARFRRMVETLAHFSLVTTLPIVLAISIYSDALVSVLGARYAPTADILRVMIWYALLVIISNAYANGLLAQNRQRVTFVVRSVGLLLNLALLLLLLPRVGVIGAPIALVVGEVVVMALLVPRFVQGAHVLPHPGKLGRVIVAGSVAGLVMGLLHAIQPPLLGAAIGGVLGFLIYAALILWLRGLDASDWSLIRQLVQAMPGVGRIVRWLPAD
jgi:O-antigen/teichoic acid export membrane protein